MNRRTWRTVVWKNRGGDCSPGYDIQGEWRACPVVPGPWKERSFAAWGQPRKAGTRMALVGGSPLLGQAHIGELVLEVVGPCWVLSAPDALQC